MELVDRKCAVCRGETPTLSANEIDEYLGQLEGWELEEACLKRGLAFKSFKEALAFFNRVAEVAEAEDHHPDMGIIEWRKVTLSLTSHAAKGLTENDFIMAAKINALI